ncbi:GNAT family N-acetyltransferase [Sphingomonas sp. URHD0057]|uniref:GNAT family N-acetyltransferase n=1 Tax=Sphingomonas sp. URHD0057 TaxID=1380389 RepID=UPI0004908298|nr:GNAT family N-acetyltransferase [Sphingomonas sp. URHD0057]
MTDLTIRPAAEADLPAIGRLGAALVAEHHEFDPLRFLAPLPDIAERYAQFIGSRLGNSDAVVLVAERNGVLGYTFATLEGFDFMALRGPAGVIQDIIVDERARRQGIARVLLEALFARLAAQGAPRIVLSTAQKNLGAQALFESEGFRRTMIEMTREL